MFKIYSVDQDTVISSAVGIGKTTYGQALEHLHPLINQLAIQRKLQDPKFYDRLKRDILNGCIMPPITIAYVAPKSTKLDKFDEESLQTFMLENIKNAFILDGIQRLNTLHRASNEVKPFDLEEHPLYLNVIVCKTMDSLLYRMITLNNGQKGMTTRHQIEIVTSNMYDFTDSDLIIETEKSSKKKRGAFKKADFVLAYLAFLSNSTTVDSQKLIEEKLDQLIAFKILESNPIHSEVEFSDALEIIDGLCENSNIKAWFRNSNNLIGFSSAIKNSHGILKTTSPKSFEDVLMEFERAFASFSVSKIKLGQARRNAVHRFIAHYKTFQKLGHLEMMEVLAAYI